STQTYGQGIEFICQNQKEFVKSSVESKWNLAEAQQKLGSLALHNSESTDQEYAKAQTEASELRQREEEWRRKEAALIQRGRQNLWNTDPFSKEVFNKVRHINVYQNDYNPFLFHLFLILSMLGRWDDSQRFLSDHPYLVCEETAKYLILWCFHLEAKQVLGRPLNCLKVCSFPLNTTEKLSKLMSHLITLLPVFPCPWEEGYLEAFKTELEAFKSRVRICSQSQGFQAMSVQNPSVYTGIIKLSILHLLQNANDVQGCVNRSVCNLNSVLQKDEEPKMMDTV
ncbi:CD37L protein, partial [Alopecoenas beccarii]|nr:CD37L protein [Alopecoenas beccarii]